MLIIEYCKEGKPLGDFEVEDLIKNFPSVNDIEKENVILKFSSELAIHATRIAAIHHNYNYSQLAFLFKGEIILLDEYWELQKWPVGFCDI